jgi:hypothetical protein
MFVGGFGATSRLVVGPDENRGDDIIPIIHRLGGIHEAIPVERSFPMRTGILRCTGTLRRAGKALQPLGVPGQG